MSCFDFQTGFALFAVIKSKVCIPRTVFNMTRVRNFVADLAKAGKGVADIKKLVDAAYEDKSLSLSQIYRIVKLVRAGGNAEDQRRFNPKKTARTGDLVASVAAAVSENRRLTVRAIAKDLLASKDTVHRILKDSLGLSKKSARWVPKLLSPEQKDRRVATSTALVQLIQDKGRSFLDKIITMDETAVSLHTPETKKQSMQWIKKGQPGPLKARVHATRQKIMVLAFFDRNGIIYTNVVPQGQTVNAAYMVQVLAQFLKRMRQKRPALVAQKDWLLHWDNAPVHTATAVKDFLAKKDIAVLEHPPYSPDLAPADFFLFPKIKEELAGRTLTRATFLTEWSGVVSTIAKDDFAAAFRRWIERCEKCVQIGGDYVEKS